MDCWYPGRMSKRGDHPILYSTVAGVLATAICALLAFLVPGLCRWTLDAGSAAWKFLTATAGTPHWALIALAIVAAPTIYRTVRLLVPAKRSSPTTRPAHFTDYTEDTFFGVVWRWGYQQGQLLRPAGFCPACDTRLVYSEPFRGICVNLICEHCHKVVYEGEGGLEDALNRVERQVERKIRSGEWQHIVEVKPTSA